MKEHKIREGLTVKVIHSDEKFREYRNGRVPKNFYSEILMNDKLITTLSGIKDEHQLMAFALNMFKGL